jgi:hypothetical protein
MQTSNKMITENYLSIPAMSLTYLNEFERSPLHYKELLKNGLDSTKSMEMGMLFKTAILNPSDFESHYFKMPQADMRTVEGKIKAKESKAANEGKIAISYDMYYAIEKMRENVYSHGLASKLLNAQHQVPYFWNDKDTLVSCKTIASIVKDRKIMAEVVTTTNADPAQFLQKIIDYKYYRKAAFQLDAAKIRGPYYIIAVEKQAPFAVSVMRIPSELIRLGRKEYKQLLKYYSVCELTNNWPGYECKDADETLKLQLKIMMVR